MVFEIPVIVVIIAANTAQDVVINPHIVSLQSGLNQPDFVWCFSHESPSEKLRRSVIQPCLEFIMTTCEHPVKLPIAFCLEADLTLNISISAGGEPAFTSTNSPSPSTPHGLFVLLKYSLYWLLQPRLEKLSSTEPAVVITWNLEPSPSSHLTGVLIMKWRHSFLKHFTWSRLNSHPDSCQTFYQGNGGTVIRPW